MGNIITRHRLCCYCSSDEKYYYNPLLEIHTVGKRNGQIVCFNCFKKKYTRVSINSNARILRNEGE